MGMWWDCDAPGGIITNCRVNNSFRSGIFVEISSGDNTSPRPLPAGAAYGFQVTNNMLNGNNTSSAQPHAGIHVVCSRNVLVDGNIVTNSNVDDINAINDSRLNNGHAGCASGFTLQNVMISNNQYGPQDIVGCSTTGVTCSGNTLI
jgi:hypothetical protein